MKSLSKFALIALMTSALSVPAFATSGSGGSASAGSSGGSSATGTNSGAGGSASVSGSANVGTGAAIGTNTNSGVSAGSNTGTGSSATTRAQVGTTNTNAGNNTGTGSSGVSRNTSSATMGSGINATTDTLRGQVNGRNIDTDTAANTSVIGSGVAGTNVVGGVVGTGSRAAVNGVVNGAAVGTNAAADSLVQYSQNDFVRSDTDRSNTLSFDEYMTYSGTTGGQSEAQSRFAKFDVNNDNFLSEAELRASGSAAVSTTP